jgi:hypothetical protein
MKKLTLLIVALLSIHAHPSTTINVGFNLDFEQNTQGKTLPDGWHKVGYGNYDVQRDSTTVFSGKYSTCITSNDEGKTLGKIVYDISANYKGRRVTLEGYIKVQDVKGNAGLSVHFEEDGNTIAYGTTMQTQVVRGTSDWKQYSIKTLFPHSVDTIYISGILSGKGKVWFDNFTVKIDYTDLEKIKPIARPFYKAKLDKEFDAGSRFNITQFSSKQADNLYKLGKIWGFVKYHHPEIAKGNINWDYELFRILPAINATDFDAKLANWVKSVGALNKEKETKPVDDKIKIKPNTAWIRDENLLSKELSQELVKIEKTTKETQHYYVDLNTQNDNPFFTHEKVYPTINFTDDGYRLLTLFRYWNMVEYFFPYKHLMDENWDAVLKEFIPKIAHAQDDLSYKLAILTLIGKIQDTHANMGDPVLSKFYGINTIPIDIKIVENKAVVVKLWQSDNPLSLKIGDIITEINGVKTTDLINEKIKYCPASNKPTQLRIVARRLLQTNEKTLKLKLENKETHFEENINCIPLGELYKFQSVERANILSHKVIDTNIGYIYPEALKKGEIDEIMPKFMDKKGLIIDSRCYPSDYIVRSLSFYLMPKSTEYVKWTRGSLENPGQFSYKSNTPLSVGYDNKNYFKGKVIILINEMTQSAAEHTVMALRVAPKALVLGSTTAGADGDVSDIVLPGNIKTQFSAIGCDYPNGTETQRVGIVPDIRLSPTIEGIRQGKDELLEKAIEIIK